MCKKGVIIIDDNKAFIEAVKSILGFRKDIEVLAEAYNGEQFLQLLEKYSPDAVLMDINMPNMDGFQATKQGLAKEHQIKFIGVTMSDNKHIHMEMIKSGFVAGIVKDQFTQQINTALEFAFNNKVYFPVLN